MCCPASEGVLLSAEQLPLWWTEKDVFLTPNRINNGLEIRYQADERCTFSVDNTVRINLHPNDLFA